jgi:hypothetical protein
VNKRTGKDDIMVTLIGFNKKIKHIIQHYIKHMNLRLPTIFEIGSASEHSKLPKKRPGPRSRVKKDKVYHLFGDGAFGGLVLHSYLLLKNKEELFSEIQAANLHAMDVYLEERISDLAKVIRGKRFRNHGELKKSELNTNKKDKE